MHIQFGGGGGGVNACLNDKTRIVQVSDVEYVKVEA